MSLLSFDKEELIEIGKVLVSFYCDPKNPVDENLIKKIEYQIEHIERQEKTVAKFLGWGRQLSEQKK